MQALIFAAGVSRRLAGYLEGKPKCLLSFAGKTLLERHMANLARYGVGRVTVVTGYLADTIERGYAAFPGLAIRFARNDRFREGSILSMIRGLETAGPDDLLLMDADVLYEPEVLGRLVRAKGCAFLLDETAAETGEEMMLGARDGLVRTIARRVGADWDEVGEGVGFFRVTRELAPRLLAIAREHSAAGETSLEYEAALDILLREHPAGYAKVGDLAWTEIDFPADVERAAREILPRVLAAERT
ncbi:MAG: phosphocholine cytidylyltransferase family protein [Planctomycetes bacterium]|nr:phosphocholine cytidylyltransferase family protein [Planctomycetota bacterium]